MSELNVFLAAAIPPLRSPDDIRRDAVALLERRGIIDGFYDEELGWYAAGPRSGEVFSAKSENPAFEYAIVYSRREAHFVPDSHTGGFGAMCTQCLSDLDEEVYALLNEQGEGDDAVDVSGAAFTCPTCRLAIPLTALHAEIATAVTRFFVNFCVVDTFEISPDLIQALEALVGTPIRVIPERL
jgi:hypothetical protein